MKAIAWPFLISASKALDYCTVVAPELVCEVASRVAREFGAAAGGSETPPGQVMHRKWRSLLSEGAAINSGLPLDVVFRVLEATTQHLGQSEAITLLDNYGRDIYLIEGLVFLEAPIEVARKHIAIAHQEVLPFFQEFWRAGRDWMPKPSGAVELEPEFEKAEQLVVVFQPSKYDAPSTVRSEMSPSVKSSLRNSGSTAVPRSAAPQERGCWTYQSTFNIRYDEEEIVSLTFSQDGVFLASRTDRQHVTLRSVLNRIHCDLPVPPGKLGKERSPYLLSFDPEDSSAFLLVFNNTPEGHYHSLHHVARQDYMGITYHVISKDSAPIRMAAITGGGQIITVDESNQLFIWKRKSILGSIASVFSSAFSSRGDWDYELDTSFDLVDRAISFGLFFNKHTEPTFVTGDTEGGVRIYRGNFSHAMSSRRMALHSGAVAMLAISQNGEYLASTDGRDVCILNINSERILQRIPLQETAVTGLTFCPYLISAQSRQHQFLLIVSDKSGYVRFWPLSQGKELPGIKLRAGSSQAIAVKPDGSFLVIATGNGQLEVWRQEDTKS